MDMARIVEIGTEAGMGFEPFAARQIDGMGRNVINRRAALRLDRRGRGLEGVAKAEQASAAVRRRIGELRTLRLLIVVVEDLVEEAARIVAGQGRGLGAIARGGGGGGAGRRGGVLPRRGRFMRRLLFDFAGQRGELGRTRRRQRRGGIGLGSASAACCASWGWSASAVSTGGSAGFNGA